eukprot:6464643-Alexandrium_andersonii.AAC.1
MSIQLRLSTASHQLKLNTAQRHPVSDQGAREALPPCGAWRCTTRHMAGVVCCLLGRMLAVPLA